MYEFEGLPGHTVACLHKGWLRRRGCWPSANRHHYHHSLYVQNLWDKAQNKSKIQNNANLENTFTYLHIPSHTFTIHKFSCFIVFVMSHHISSPFDILWEPLISASETSWFHPIELPWVLHCFGSPSVAWQASQFTAMRARFQGMQCIKMYQT